MGDLGNCWCKSRLKRERLLNNLQKFGAFKISKKDQKQKLTQAENSRTLAISLRHSSLYTSEPQALNLYL